MEVTWLLHQLGVSHLLHRNLTLEETRDLKRRRRDFQRKWHPDKTVDAADVLSRTALLQRFNAAWELLEPRLAPEPIPRDVGVTRGSQHSFSDPVSSSSGKGSPYQYPWEFRDMGSPTQPTDFRSTFRSSRGRNHASSSDPSQSAHGQTGNTGNKMPWNTTERPHGKTRNKMPSPAKDGRRASNDVRSSRSPIGDHNIVARTCCPLAPHCSNFDKKYGKKGEDKQLEYRYLYAAQAHCLRCMKYYFDQEAVNPRCRSENKNARDWAMLYNTSIPDDLEAWLASQGM